VHVGIHQSRRHDVTSEERHGHEESEKVSDCAHESYNRLDSYLQAFISILSISYFDFVIFVLPVA